MARIKLGLVGVGKIARDQHLPVLAQSADFELVAVASRNASVAGMRSYASLAEMLDAEPGIEAVSLCTPPTAREADARHALARGKHVLLEKPPTATLSAARGLIACADGAALCASWHSRHAPAVERARAVLAERTVRCVEVAWKEDIRHSHPGQDWILDAGGMGVFDTGINALSILTHIFASDITLLDANLDVPANRQAPIAAALRLRIGGGAELAMALDFLAPGAPEWRIHVDTDRGPIVLHDGGARLEIDGAEIPVAQTPHHEYVGVYARFAEAVRARRTDLDLRPLELTADAFMSGRRRVTEPFAWEQ